jgi:hypothetical protein
MAEQLIPRILNLGDRFFADGPDRRNNSCVGKQLFPHNGLRAYSDGFLLAARSLVDRIVEGKTTDLPIDAVVYPIVFLYRHHLELMLKRIRVSLAHATGKKPEVVLGHDLSKLWVDALREVESFLGGVNWTQNQIASLLIQELSSVDPSGQAGRYPESTSRERHFLKFSVLNVRHFAETAERLSKYLGFILSLIDAAVDEKLEYEADMRCFHGY